MSQNVNACIALKPAVDEAYTAADGIDVEGSRKWIRCCIILNHGASKSDMRTVKVVMKKGMLQRPKKITKVQQKEFTRTTGKWTLLLLQF